MLEPSLFILSGPVRLKVHRIYGSVCTLLYVFFRTSEVKGSPYLRISLYASDPLRSPDGYMWTDCHCHQRE